MLRQGELAVDTEFGEVTVDGQSVSLSPTEYALLMALIAAPGEVVRPDRLAREVWSEPASANLVQVYISYLRRKIGAGAHPDGARRGLRPGGVTGRSTAVERARHPGNGSGVNRRAAVRAGRSATQVRCTGREVRPGGTGECA